MVARHEKYYFEDGNVIFQVGKTLFRIHKRLLIGSESSLFASMLTLRNIEGQTDERPIVLEGDSPEQFEALMKILYPSVLANVFNIPVVTYTQAMRIAVKYSMDDIQTAIADVIPLIPLQPQHDLGKAILRLAFVAEFPSHFFTNDAIKIFTDASPINHHPTAGHLKPLLPHPEFLALMMQYREALSSPETAIWRKQVNVNGFLQNSTQQKWFNEEFGRFGFKPKK